VFCISTRNVHTPDKLGAVVSVHARPFRQHICAVPAVVAYGVFCISTRNVHTPDKLGAVVSVHTCPFRQHICAVPAVVVFAPFRGACSRT
jgi:hypothetical protein